MDPPLGPALANIFVGYRYYESFSIWKSKKNTDVVYYHYVNNIFAIFDSENDCDKFLH